MKHILFTVLMLLVSLSWSARAQLGDYDGEENDPSATESEESTDAESEEDAEGFTGTYADEEDPDSPKYQQKLEEEEIFGEDEKDHKKGHRGREDGEEVEDVPGDEFYPEEEFPEDEPNYVLKFLFDSNATFYDKLTGEAYMEINYRTVIEQEVSMIEKRFRTKGEVNFETDIIGNYAGNELFTCRLEIEIRSSPVQIMTRLRNVTTPEDAIPLFEAALQLKFEKKYKEDWYSNCTGIDGSLFNTKGDPEKYNLMILEDTTPNLNAMLIEEFVPGNDNELEIIMEPLDLEDPDMDTVSLTGKGTLTLEAL